MVTRPLATHADESQSRGWRSHHNHNHNHNQQHHPANKKKASRFQNRYQHRRLHPFRDEEQRPPSISHHERLQMHSPAPEMIQLPCFLSPNSSRTVRSITSSPTGSDLSLSSQNNRRARQRKKNKQKHQRRNKARPTKGDSSSSSSSGGGGGGGGGSSGIATTTSESQSLKLLAPLVLSNPLLRRCHSLPCLSAAEIRHEFGRLESVRVREREWGEALQDAGVKEVNFLLECSAVSPVPPASPGNGRSKGKKPRRKRMVKGLTVDRK